jgi:hypothetical protein
MTVIIDLELQKIKEELRPMYLIGFLLFLS